MKNNKLNKVWVVSCEETSLKNVVCDTDFGIGDLIESDMAENTEVKLFHYIVAVKYMSDKYLNKLGEYEG